MQKIEEAGFARLRRGADGQKALRQLIALGCGAAAAGGTLFGVLAPFGLALVLGAGEGEYLAAARIWPA